MRPSDWTRPKRENEAIFTLIVNHKQFILDEKPLFLKICSTMFTADEDKWTNNILIESYNRSYTLQQPSINYTRVDKELKAELLRR